MSHHMMPMMKMYFHFGFEDSFLFEKLNVDSCLKLWAVCGALFVLTILLEAIKYYRCVSCGCATPRSACVATNGEAQDSETTTRLASTCFVGKHRTRRHKLIQAALHTLQTTIGFLLMLAVMSFNLCIIFAILVGTGVGYYVFYRSYNEIESIDSCH